MRWENTNGVILACGSVAYHLTVELEDFLLSDFFYLRPPSILSTPYPFPLHRLPPTNVNNLSFCKEIRPVNKAYPIFVRYHEFL